jgi:hypothetical protein
MKLLFFITTVFMFLGFTIGSYGQALVYVSSTQTEPLAVGEHIHLNIQIVGAKNVSGYELTVGFDPTALRYIEGENADYLPAGAFTIPPIVTENTVYMTATSGAEVAPASEGALARLSFEVIAAKGSTIELIDVILSDSAAIPLTVISKNGRIVTIELPPNWDVNEDGRVNILDLTLVASNLNVDAPENQRVDVNRDGNVNILDLVLVAQNLDAADKEGKPEVRIRLVVDTRNVAFVFAIPPSGSRLSANASIVIHFDSDPGNVTVNVGSVSGAGTSRTIAGPFPLGFLSLSVEWDGNNQTLAYAVVTPDAVTPRVIGGTVKDAGRDVDPEAINHRGIIEIVFNEAVVGSIELQTEGGDDTGWIGKVEGNKGILELVEGKEIRGNTVYVIKGKVADGAGNELTISIIFATKAKE